MNPGTHGLESASKDPLPPGWVLADPSLDSLGALQGKPLNSYRLVVLLGPRNRVGARYFQVFLRSHAGEMTAQPLVIGLHAAGKHPPSNWIEIMSFSSVVDTRNGDIARIDERLSRQIYQYLADVIPPGGHMMVEYDSPEQEDTARALARGVPPAATPLGYLLFSVGCGVGFKDWYFAEGGDEGPRKLQGYKALNKEHSELKAAETACELAGFLQRMPSESRSELEKAAGQRALAVLSALQRNAAGHT